MCRSGGLILAVLMALAPAAAQPAKRSALEVACETIAVERNVEYAKAGDVRLLLDVYRPKPDGGGGRPCIVSGSSVAAGSGAARAAVPPGWRLS